MNFFQTGCCFHTLSTIASVGKLFFCLGQQEQHEQPHQEDPAHEEENVGAHVAQHREEGLGYEEREQHVGADRECEPGGPCLNGECLAGYRPTERAPRPCECPTNKRTSTTRIAASLLSSEFACGFQVG